MATASTPRSRKTPANAATSQSVSLISRAGLDNSGPQRARKRTSADRSRDEKLATRFKRGKRSKKPRTEQMSKRDTGFPISWSLYIPYAIMLQIFQLAAYPLCDDLWYPNSSVSWLLRTALVCKSFLEPALAALYFCPPLLPLPRAHKLLHLLENSDTASMNYRTKIKHLEIEVVGVLSLKPPGLAKLDLSRLIELCPQLQKIAFHLHEDISGYRGVQKRTIAAYKDTLFDQLDKKLVDLRSFKWNFHIMANSSTPWNQLSAIHSRRCFRNIHDLEIAHFGDVHKGSQNRWTNLAEELRNSLPILEHLQSIKITKSRLCFSQDLFENIHNLKTLRFDDCDELDSEQLGAILQFRGTHLQELVLKHNKRLNLEFTACLAEICHALEVLEIDFQCFNTLGTGGAEVLFQSILLPGTVPTWPASLRQLKLAYLRKWDLRIATCFFNSLWVSAAHLPNLRTLQIRSSIEEGWKERKEFRDLWVKRIETAFRRKLKPPQRFYELTANKKSPGTTNGQDVGDDSDAPLSSKMRLTHRKPTAPTVKQTVDTRFLSKSLSYPVTQPLCDTVDIRIDNLRPMQTMYREEDFMDSEPSGDEEWNGDDTNAEPTYAW